MVAKYSISVSAFVPTADSPCDNTGKHQPIYHEASASAPAVLETNEAPNPQWTPLNDEAVAAQKAELEKLITREKDYIAALSQDRDGAKSRMLHQTKLTRFEHHLAGLKVGEPPPPIGANEAETMSAMNKSIAAGPQAATTSSAQVAQPSKGGRPSDRPDRR